jgi:hypothetical protein
MNDLLPKILVDGPPLAVLCIVVWLFLKHTKAVAKDTRELFRILQAEHVDERRQTREVIAANTIALHEATKAQTHLAETVQACQLQCVRMTSLRELMREEKKRT